MLTRTKIKEKLIGSHFCIRSIMHFESIDIITMAAMLDLLLSCKLATHFSGGRQHGFERL